MPDTEVFIIAVSQHPDPAEAVRGALKASGVNPLKVQDAIFGWDSPTPAPGAEILSKTGLSCPYVEIPSSMRALFFAAQSILSGDLDVLVAAGNDAAFVLASPSAVGRYNLIPQAILGAHSLAGAEETLKRSGFTPDEMTVGMEGEHGALLVVQMLAALADRNAARGMIKAGSAAMLIERV